MSTIPTPPPASLAELRSSTPAWADGTWADRANCRGIDVDLFFAVEEAEQERALALCRTCPVRAECLEHAVRHQEMYGIWGGMLENDRRRLIRDVRRRDRETRRNSTDAA